MTSTTVEIQDAQTRLEELVREAGQGKDIVLTNAGVPIARLLPIVNVTPGPRVAGLHPGTVWMSDDFDEPLPDEFWLGSE